MAARRDPARGNRGRAETAMSTPPRHKRTAGKTAGRWRRELAVHVCFDAATSRRTALILSCHPEPPAWKYSSTSRSIRKETSSFGCGRSESRGAAASGGIAGDLKAASAAARGSLAERRRPVGFVTSLLAIPQENSSGRLAGPARSRRRHQPSAPAISGKQGTSSRPGNRFLSCLAVPSGERVEQCGVHGIHPTVKRQRHRLESAGVTQSLPRRLQLATKKLASHRVEYSKDDIRQLKALIKAKTPMAEIGRTMGRTAAGVRMKATKLGILPKRRNKPVASRARR